MPIDKPGESFSTTSAPLWPFMTAFCLLGNILIILLLPLQCWWSFRLPCWAVEASFPSKPTLDFTHYHVAALASLLRTACWWRETKEGTLGKKSWGRNSGKGMLRKVHSTESGLIILAVGLIYGLRLCLLHGYIFKVYYIVFFFKVYKLISLEW